MLSISLREGVDRHQFFGVVNLMFSKLGAESLEQAHLLVVELNRLLPVGFLEAQQAVMFGEQIVTLPHVTHAAVDTLQSKFLARLGWDEPLYCRAVCRASPRRHRSGNYDVLLSRWWSYGDSR